MRITIKDLELTEDCQKCEGYGVIYSWAGVRAGNRIECDRCGTSGQVLSENGEELIEFLKRFWNEVG